MVGDSVKVDICDMFEEEVTYAVGDSDEWSPSIIFDSRQPDRQVSGHGQEVRRPWRHRRSGRRHGRDARRKYFKTVWFDDDLNEQDQEGRQPPIGAPPRSLTWMPCNDLYNQNQDEGNLDVV